MFDDLRDDDDPVREFHLIRRKGTDNAPWWHEYAPHPHDGRMAYLNFQGAGAAVTDKEEVLKKAHVQYWTDLDWHGTDLERPGSEAGWLDRSGRFYGCGPESHDMYARYLLKKPIIDLENTGWVRVYGKGVELEWSIGFRDGLRMSDEQKMWLDRNGYKVEEWH